MSETVAIAELERLAKAAFVRAGATPEIATRVGAALVFAERDGQTGHGLSRVPSYAGQVASGKVDGTAVPQMVRPAPGVIQIDAGHGFAFPAIDLTLDGLIEIAPEQGIACATIRRSHHAGQLGPHVERLADAGLVALMVANTPAAMAPWGGKTGLLGTNPIAFAAPRAEVIPLVIDLSLSAVARGKVMAAKRNGTKIPEGIALDRDGNPTTDPDAALAGTMVPAGGAKGAALALMVEVMAAALSGAKLAGEASSLFDDKGDPPGLGQTIVAIDPGVASGGTFAATLERLASAIEADGEARLPGATRMERRARTEIDVADAILADLRAFAGE